MAPQTGLTRRHIGILHDSAITETAATAWGIYTAHDTTDLPDDLKDNPIATESLPGMVFPLRRLDGTTVHQLRPDSPIKPTTPTPNGGVTRKYIQPSGIGSVINVPAMMADRVGVAPTILIVEGTKQTIAVSQYVDEHTLVIGVQGCSNWSTDGVPVEDLQTVCSMGATRVEVLFDADVQKNRNVYDAAKRIQKVLTVTLGIKDVVFVRLADGGFTGKAGIDDALGGVAEDQRVDLLNRLRATATNKLGRAPAIQRDHTPLEESWVEVRMDEGRTVRVTPTTTGDATITPLCDFAAEITNVDKYFINDDMTSPCVYAASEVTVDARVRRHDGKVATSTFKVPSTEFEQVNKWLDRVDGGTHLPRFTKPGEQVEVAGWFRKACEGTTEETMSVLRTGWFLDDLDPDSGPQWRWLHTEGAIGVHDTSTTLRGLPESGPLKADMRIPDPHQHADSDIVDAVRKFIGVRDLLKPECSLAWDAAMGVFGLAFLPIIPGVTLAYFGKFSGGKTVLASALTSCLSPRWLPENKTVMATFGMTAAAADTFPNGAHHVFLHVDDLKPEQDRNERVKVIGLFDTLLRRAHGSGSRLKGTTNTQSGDIGLRKQDKSSPITIFTGEQIPVGGDLAKSALDRMFIVDVEGKMFQPHGDDDGEGALHDLYRRTHHFPKVTAAYVKWLAAHLAQRGVEAGGVQAGMDAFKAAIDERIQAAIDESLFKELGKKGTSTRAVGVAARIYTGALIFLEFAQSIGAITNEERLTIGERTGLEILRQAAYTTSMVMDDGQTDSDEILNQVRSLVASGRATIGTEELRGGVTRIGVVGKMHTDDGSLVDVVNLIPSAVSTIIGNHGGPKEVVRAFRGVAVGGTRGPGKVCRNAKIGGAQVDVITIPMSVWDPSMGDGDLEQAALTMEAL